MGAIEHGLKRVPGYGRPYEGRLYAGQEPAEHPMEEVHAAFRAFLHDPDFPCLGARSIVNQQSYRFGLYGAMGTPESTEQLAVDLNGFIEERPSIEGDFTSYIACFREPKIVTPKQFETQLWHQLLALHEIDADEHEWAAGVSSDPEETNFSFSFGGHAFFIVGLSPSSRRWARRFPWPVLVFNDHAQFERLRREQRFERLKGVIRQRDEHLHGTPNEMLEDFGAHSEARQYSGRQVGPGWRCPVQFHGEKHE